MKIIYHCKYPAIDTNMSDSNIGARKEKNIRNHTFVVNTIIHEINRSKSNKPVEIFYLDYCQMFDTMNLPVTLNDAYNVRLNDDALNLIYQANKMYT